jgi:hypothetical protein
VSLGFSSDYIATTLLTIFNYCPNQTNKKTIAWRNGLMGYNTIFSASHGFSKKGTQEKDKM